MRQQDVFEAIVCPRSKERPRQSEGSVVPLKDGRLLLAYSDFYGGEMDEASAQVSAKISEDGGYTWGDSFTLQENIAGQNVSSPTLLRLKSGTLAFFHGKKNSRRDLKKFMRKSYDEGQHWGEPVCVTPDDGYHVMNNDRVIQLGTGRLLAPISLTPDVVAVNRFKSLCFYSDDEGATWHRGQTMLDLPGRGAMEPGLVELEDGRTLMVIRSQLGHIFRAYSSDGGVTWSEPEKTTIRAPESPATIKRIPTTQHLLLIWNDHYDPYEPMYGRRSPLVAAISRDEGETWENRRELESDPEYTYAYVSVDFSDDRAVFTYYQGLAEDCFWSLKLKIAPVGWFYSSSP